MKLEQISFTIRWSAELGEYVAKCDVRPTLACSSQDPEDALADLVWTLKEQERRP